MRIQQEKEKIEGILKHQINEKILDKLIKFKGKSKLRKASMMMIVKIFAKNKQIQNLTEEFLKINKDGSGLISDIELTLAI